MAAENITEFKIQVLRALAALYASHPKPIYLGPPQLLDPPPKSDDHDLDARTNFSGGTILWLYRNGLITGNLEDIGNTFCVMLSQLSPRAYAILNSVDANAGRVFGEAISDAVLTKDERELSVLADRLNDRLS